MLEAALRGSALLALTWGVLKALRLQDLAAEKNVWTLVAMAALAMPVLSWALLTVVPPLGMLPSHPLLSAATLRGVHPGLPANRIPQLGLLLYLLGMAAWAARFVIGLWLSLRIRRSALRLPGLATHCIDVRVSTRIRTPASFAATILLPSGYESWDPSMLAAVLAHEVAHIRNRDCYRMWLAALYRAVFWFNPLAHLLYGRLQMLSELTSDEAAAAAIGDRATYAEVLRRVASKPLLLSATIAMAAHSTLSRRLKGLMDTSPARPPLGRRQNALLTVAILLLVALAAVPSGRAALAAQRLAALEFYLVDDHGDANLAQRTGQLPPGDRLYEDAKGHPVLLHNPLAVKPAQISVTPTDNGIAVKIRLDERSAALMSRTTRENIGHRMVVVYVDPSLAPQSGGGRKQQSAVGQVISEAVIKGAFGSQFQIMGLSADQARTLASQVDQTLVK